MSEVVKNKKRYGVMRLTDALGYRLPLAGFVSILHRASGLLMFLLLPFVLYLLEQSLQSEVSFAMMHIFASSVIVKIVLLALVWAYLHHFSAGVRHLFMDFHVGVDKDSGRRSAVAVLLISLGLTALVALKLFGVF
ncbi:succinate dehydrogenase, cytochrome b556 subunit [Undibacterium macrobrachii]|jgi:succinate dehydrogenase / fumarate reductase cytochrome b subunit|uniref:Succinate dehydrogenase cytochrome b556 subunit n=1 Tax=Undibacterium macrobrachii TaxID=1119058 RepID=A0ABQ2X4L9_9BURK|nr:succinate dehydrogenase, cytochrome b556 subunit [Undibacterium macrobrachii]GGW99580.1 succinate dehydrogenase cytochrome b-556 subunit [Undibacterium macrobrachii]